MNYPGGKGLQYKKIINLIPPHEVYIETHLGGGSIMRKKRPARRNIGVEIDPKVIQKWSTITGIEFELIHGDAIKHLRSYEFRGKEFVYCDPPYLRHTRKKYYPLFKYEYREEDHIKLLEVIKSLPCMVMISGYESSLYMESLKDWSTYVFQATTHHGMATEWIWMNYPAPLELHDYRYLGDTFRERERIKRKSQRWVARLKKIPVLERQALLSAIGSMDEKH
ncbi:MAG: DNA adenine methylase [Planctomycetes bacterium]|nr:DNA adenine methylase [Planctomycetota bacterium]